MILVSIIAVSVLSIIEILPVLVLAKAIIGIIVFCAISYVYINKLMKISGISLKTLKGKFNKWKIGDKTLIGQYVTIMDFEAHGTDPAKRREIGTIGTVTIGKNVWIANNVIILKNSIVSPLV